MKQLIALQISPILEKAKNAPDEGYQIGLAIGAYLPFVFFVLIAYFLYYKSKNKSDN